MARSAGVVVFNSGPFIPLVPPSRKRQGGCRPPSLPGPRQSCRNWTMPVFLPLHQTLLHWIQMHVLQARREFLLVSHKAIPILVLPERPMGTPPRVQPRRHHLFWRHAAPARSATDTAAKSVRASCYGQGTIVDFGLSWCVKNREQRPLPVTLGTNTTCRLNEVGTPDQGMACSCSTFVSFRMVT